MQVKLGVDTFMSSSKYTLADIKKAKFIFSAMDKLSSSKNKDVENLCVLDAGCGRGWIAFLLASLGCQVTAFDINENSVRYVQSQVNRNKIKNLIVTMDDGYTFDDGQTYDVVIASEVFEHVLEASKLAANLTTKMMKGSYLIVTTPNGYGPYELKNRISPIPYLRKWNWLRRLLGKSPCVEEKGSGHYQFYTKKRLVKLFSEFSLILIDSVKVGSFLMMFEPCRRSALLENVDAKLADVLSYWLANGWYLLFEMRR